MKSLHYIPALLPMLLLPAFLFAQADSSKENKPHVKIGMYYNSHLNYYGRTDSLRSSGVFPMAELWFNKNFYINAAPVFVHNATISFQYAGTVATAGYMFNNNKFAGNIYAVKPFYKDNSQLVQSALKAQFAASFTWLSKIINITGGADARLSDKMDYGITAGLDHIFRHQFESNTVLVIDPSAYLYAGTQQFTSTYYKKEGGFLFFPGTAQQVTSSADMFTILSYELSVPVIIAKGKWQFLCTPAYVMPQNVITVQGNNSIAQKGKNLFYTTVGCKVSL